jgi:hypothetical protein
VRRPPLYTPEEARAEAEREGEKDDINARAALDGCGCCLIEGLQAVSGLAAILLVPVALMR